MPAEAAITLPVNLDFTAAYAQMPRAAGELQRLLNRNLSSLGQPLGKLSGSANEFTKSLEAANARVVAFGASAGIIYGVQRALLAVVDSTVKVEKTLTDVNVVLNESGRGLQKFGQQLFSIAAQTGKTFDQVGQAALELSRQGLSVEQTLKRTKDALILSRLSGLEAASSVEAITAALNSFQKELITSTGLVNKFAAVDAAFAVSSADLAEAIKRVGSTAEDAGVNLDELNAIVTAVQQTTARGGAVIGNALKSIFTRVSRSDTIQELRNLGVAIDANQSGIEKLKALSDAIKNVGVEQAAAIKEAAGGVFQINIVSAALSDLSRNYGIYEQALRKSEGATDDAIRRNEELNRTLDALINRTGVNLKNVFSQLGSQTIASPLRTILESLNTGLEGLGSDATSGIGKLGQQMGEGLLKGISSFIEGPGLIYLGTIGGRLALKLGKFALDSFKQLESIGTQRAQTEGQIVNLLRMQPDLTARILAGQISVKQAEQEILNLLNQRIIATERLAGISSLVSPAVQRSGITFDPAGTPRRRFSAGGMLPTPMEKAIESASAYANGYTPGQVKVMNMAAGGRIVYNSAEKVMNIGGQTAIVPPIGSKASAKFASRFQKQFGFSPYAAGGYLGGLPPGVKSQIEPLFAMAQAMSAGGGTPLQFATISNQIKKITNEFDKTGKTFEQLRNELISVKSAAKISKDKLSGISLVMSAQTEIDKKIIASKKELPRLNDKITSDLIRITSSKAEETSAILAKINQEAAAKTYSQPSVGAPRIFVQPANLGGPQVSDFDTVLKNAIKSEIPKIQLPPSLLDETPEQARARRENDAKLLNERIKTEQTIRASIPKIKVDVVSSLKTLSAEALKAAEKQALSVLPFRSRQGFATLQGILLPEQLAALRNQRSGRIQNLSFGASLLGPLAAETIASQFSGSQTRGGRATGAAISGLGSAIGLGATAGFLSGGNPLLIAGGAAIGVFQGITKAMEALTDITPELTKELEKLKEENVKTSAAFTEYLQISEKITLAEQGQIRNLKVGDLVNLQGRQAAAFASLPSGAQSEISALLQDQSKRANITEEILRISGRILAGQTSQAQFVSFNEGLKADISQFGYRKASPILKARTFNPFAAIGPFAGRSALFGTVPEFSNERTSRNAEIVNRIQSGAISQFRGLTSSTTGENFFQQFSSVSGKLIQSGAKAEDIARAISVFANSRGYQGIDKFFENLKNNLDDADFEKVTQSIKDALSEEEYKKQLDLLKQVNNAVGEVNSSFSRMIINLGSVDRNFSNVVNSISNEVKIETNRLQNRAGLNADVTRSRIAALSPLLGDQDLQRQLELDATLRANQETFQASAGAAQREIGVRGAQVLNAARQQFTRKAFERAKQQNPNDPLGASRAAQAAEKLFAEITGVSGPSDLRNLDRGKLSAISQSAIFQGGRLQGAVANQNGLTTDDLRDASLMFGELSSSLNEITDEFGTNINLFSDNLSTANERAFELAQIEKERLGLLRQFADFRAQETLDKIIGNIRAGANLQRGGSALTGRDLANLSGGVFAYGQKDFQKDIAEGWFQLNREVKSSFASTTADIIKNGEDIGDALTGVLRGVLESIIDKTTDIGTNLLFSGLKAAGSAAIQQFSGGGVVQGGSGTRDDVPALLTKGEYVLTKDAVARIGRSNLDLLNNSNDNRVAVKLANEFVYDNPLKPTSGSRNINPNLSTFGATDTDIGRSTGTRLAREDALFNYIRDYRDYQANVAAALSNYKRQKRNRAIGAFASAAFTIGGAGLNAAFATPPASAGATGGFSNLYTNPNASSNYGVSYSLKAKGGMTDGIPVLLTGGEFRVKPEKVKKYGKGFFDALNQNAPRKTMMYAEGGMVDSPMVAPSSSSNVVNSISNSVNFQVYISKEGSSINQTGEQSKGNAKDTELMKQLNNRIKTVVGEEIARQGRQGGIIDSLIKTKTGKG